MTEKKNKQKYNFEITLSEVAPHQMTIEAEYMIVEVIQNQSFLFFRNDNEDVAVAIFQFWVSVVRK